MLAELCLWTGALVLTSALYWLVSVAVAKFRPLTLLDGLPSRAVLITGCDSGFGHGLARRLDALGVPVFAGCLLPEGPGARSLAADCSSRLRVLPLDVTSDQQVADAVVSVREALKDTSGTELWAVVNNAGITDLGEADITPLEKFQAVLAVNTVGAIRVAKAFLPMLKKSKGRLINVNSPCGRIATPMLSPYCVSKSALIMFTDVLRLEMKKWSVTVCSVEPYLYGTPIANDEVLRSKYFKNSNNMLLYDDGIREEYIKNCEALLRATKWFSKKNISEVVDEMVVACIGQNVQRRRIPGFPETIMLTTLAGLPYWLKDFITEIILIMLNIVWGKEVVDVAQKEEHPAKN